MKTEENLQAAFAGESQANRKYLAFAERADKDGFAQVARLFRAAAAAETVHAHAHLRALSGVKSTAENLAESIEGERYEYEEMYPEFLATAEQEQNKRAQITIKNAHAVEGIHHALYKQALEAVNGGGDLPRDRIHVCAICGHTVNGEAPEVCPTCGAPHGKFFEVE